MWLILHTRMPNTSLPARRCSLHFREIRQTMDASLEDGIPKGFHPMDVGPQTTAALRVRRARSLARSIFVLAWSLPVVCVPLSAPLFAKSDTTAVDRYFLCGLRAAGPSATYAPGASGALDSVPTRPDPPPGLLCRSKRPQIYNLDRHVCSQGCRWPGSGGALARHARRGGVLGFPVRDERCLGSRNVGARQRRATGGRDLACGHPLREVRGYRPGWGAPVFPPR